MAVESALGGAPYEDDFSYDGAGRARIDMRSRSIPGQTAGSFIVFDGTRLMQYDAASNTYSSQGLASFSPFNLLGDVTWHGLLQRGCAAPRATGRDRILDREVVHVLCGSLEAWVAPDVGLILRTVDGSRHLEATRLELVPIVPAGYFDAVPPPGSKPRG